MAGYYAGGAVIIIGYGIFTGIRDMGHLKLFGNTRKY